MVGHPSAGKSGRSGKNSRNEIGQGLLSLQGKAMGVEASCALYYLLITSGFNKNCRASWWVKSLTCQRLKWQGDRCIWGNSAVCFHPDLLLVAEPSLFERYAELAFVPVRWRRSIILNTEDYKRCNPVLVQFAKARLWGEKLHDFANSDIH